MKQMITHTGTVAPLRRTNVDTDQILPARHLKRVDDDGFADALFERWRASEPEFILNQPRFAGASILVAGHDFGTGSSREHAVWALWDYGFRVIMSPRFGDIFRGNSKKFGLLTITLEEAILANLMDRVEEEAGFEVSVDVRHKQVRWDDIVYDFELDDQTQFLLTEGLDEIDLTLTSVSLIERYERRRVEERSASAGPVFVAGQPARTPRD